MAKTPEHAQPPAVLRVIELVGVSSKSWSDAAQQAVTRASQTMRHITGVNVVKSSAVVRDGKIAEYHVNVKVPSSSRRNEGEPVGSALLGGFLGPRLGASPRRGYSPLTTDVPGERLLQEAHLLAAVALNLLQQGGDLLADGCEPHPVQRRRLFEVVDGSARGLPQPAVFAV
jgi:flavin-binding protein dodecin